MDCPKCNGETESELEHSSFKADEVNDVSRCLDCGFEFYQIYRKHGKWKKWYESVGVSERHANDMESPRKEVSQTIERHAGHMEPLRKKSEYRLPSYSSTSVVYPSWYRQSY
jgi:hypothetical protein